MMAALFAFLFGALLLAVLFDRAVSRRSRRKRRSG
jgi:hypothetical protein